MILFTTLMLQPLLMYYCTLVILQAESLNEIKLHILEYVESRMTFISPNLSQIVGSTVAAKLMGNITYEYCGDFIGQLQVLLVG